MRHLAFLISIIVLVGCKTNSVPRIQSETSRPAQAPAQERQKASTDTPLQFLLNAAATDFHAQHAPHTIHFQTVRVGHVTTPDGQTQDMLCGQFLAAQPKDKSDWVPFVTIKTSGYEQYLGDQAASFCERPSVIWEDGDLSPLLQSRFNSLQ